MAETVKSTCYEGCGVSDFHFYLEKSNEHGEIPKFVHDVLPGEFKRIGAGQTSLDVLGVGDGGGQIDVQMLSLLQSAFPAVPVTADIVEGSLELTDNFKGADRAHWEQAACNKKKKLLKTKTVKKMDSLLGHQPGMIHYVDSLADTIKFFHGLLKPSSWLMIILEAGSSGSDILWKTCAKQLCVDYITEYRSSGEEHSIPNSFDITKCFHPSSKPGEHLLSVMTGTSHFSQSFSPEVRAGIWDLLRTKCSTEKDGKILFNSNLTCLLVHA
uniref:Histamine N-methyltransferase n=1 Tax=Nothobranchius furzeri TaxID=105023 RepID=A0A8C6VZ44_NOTFU